MSDPSVAELFEAIDATWPAVRQIELPGWCVREGRGGGSRVSAATATTSAPDISAMEAAQRALGQLPLVMIRDGEDALDARLAASGFTVKDPVVLYVGAVQEMAVAPPPVSAFHVEWPPTKIQEEIWADGGVGPARLAVMDRVDGEKCAILGRSADQPAGTAFVAKHGRVAMLHALEVMPSLRRKGTGVNVMHAAAIWAAARGARWMSVLVTEDNGGGNALYTGLGMTAATRYHYRVKAE
ncbi:acetyltransferase (GNAT) family protein [Aliiruegeria haliotis]|uniref:Acetyltransferase (GNAT) family protein n=1 Tax=Aliiruegeria haliotis TaxID=1280846 RepID=A0A2T0RTJ2_9RHOB|nr:GNAT family N-acetyltransferase [Aliiruegeria haliotis]PRY24504.1 acetyltransferase (GNAT) family protein [Aliiruegeria haliotis]